MKTRKVKSAGRFGAGYGIYAKKKLIAIESKQRKRQICPFCKMKAVKREAKGIWKCQKCKKRFASDVFYLD